MDRTSTDHDPRKVRYFMEVHHGAKNKGPIGIGDRVPHALTQCAGGVSTVGGSPFSSHPSTKSPEGLESPLSFTKRDGDDDGSYGGTGMVRCVVSHAPTPLATRHAY